MGISYAKTTTLLIPAYVITLTVVIVVTAYYTGVPHSNAFGECSGDKGSCL